MKKAIIVICSLVILATTVLSCSKVDLPNVIITDPYAAIKASFGTNIDLANLNNYANQTKPSYITNDNTGTNIITDTKATLGRVLFYDKNLSTNNTISCGSCHKQAFAFSDTALVSNGV